MKTRTRDAIRKLLSKGYEVSAFSKLSLKPGEDGTYTVTHGEIYDAREGRTTHDPHEEKFTSRRKAIRHFLQRRKDLLPHITAAPADNNGEAAAAKVSTKKKTKARAKK